MAIRTTVNIQSLDDELNLFDEESWNFLTTPIINQVENYEYFADVYDANYFGNKYVDLIKNTLIYAMSVLLVVIGLYFLLFFNNRVREIDNVYMSVYNEDYNKIEYVDGKEAGNDTIIAASKLLSAYFRTINAGQGYSSLNDYCLNESTFNGTYSKYVESIKSNYDINDCYARALKMLGTTLHSDKIDRIIEKDGIYYCYVWVSAPTTQNIMEYANLYKYNMLKFFQSHDINEENMLMFLIKNMKENPIEVSSSEWCIKLKKNDAGYLVLHDDMQITTNCVSTFTHIVNQMSSLIGQADLGQVQVQQ